MKQVTCYHNISALTLATTGMSDIRNLSHNWFLYRFIIGLEFYELEDN